MQNQSTYVQITQATQKNRHFNSQSVSAEFYCIFDNLIFFFCFSLSTSRSYAVPTHNTQISSFRYGHYFSLIFLFYLNIGNPKLLTTQFNSLLKFFFTEKIRIFIHFSKIFTTTSNKRERHEQHSGTVMPDVMNIEDKVIQNK